MLDADNAAKYCCIRHESSKTASKFCSSSAATGTTAPDFFSNSPTQANFVWSKSSELYGIIASLDPVSQDTCPTFMNVKGHLIFSKVIIETSFAVAPARQSELTFRGFGNENRVTRVLVQTYGGGDWTKNLAIQVERYASWKLCIRPSIDGIG